MTITKEDVSAVIEKLVDKSLTFGCEIAHNGKLYKYVRDTGEVDCYYAVVELVNIQDNARLNIPYVEGIGREKTKWKPGCAFMVLGHPILLGDVLERMRNDESGTVDGWNTQEAAWIKLCELWQPLGFTKSLQEIAEMIEWESGYIHNGVFCESECTVETETAKPSPATELFEFLVSLSTLNPALWKSKSDQI